MEPVSTQTATVTATTVTSVPGPPDLLTPLLRALSGSAPFDLFSGAFSFFGTIWSIYTVLAYIVSAFLLYIFIYSSIQLGHIKQQKRAAIKEQEDAWQHLHGKPAQESRFTVIEEQLASSNPNDWKLSIIEADVLLDEALKRNGFSGTTLGERLQSVSADNLQTLDDAWTAHKVRNQIAHGGEDFVLTQKLARDTIARYRNVFQELGLL